MLARVQSYLLQGIDALPCEVEIAVNQAVEKRPPTVVGLPDAAVKESVERVRAALFNSGYLFPEGHVLVNLAPADVRKEGPAYDLCVAVGVLLSQGVIRPEQAAEQARKAGVRGPVTLGRRVGSGAGRGTGSGKRRGEGDGSGDTTMQSHGRATGYNGESASDSDELADLDAAIGKSEPEVFEPLDPRRYLIAGELALDGRLRPVRGVIAMAALAKAMGMRGVVVPMENAPEAAVVPEVESIGVSTLTEVVGLMNGQLEAKPHPPLDIGGLLQTATAEIDFAEVRGQEAVKRAIIIAAAGSHNLLMLGPAGTGKTMMAKALPGVLPPLSPEEAIEITRIYSAAGELPAGTGLVSRRPVRTPHHTASGAAIVGGGVVPRPGEISLAHRGVLFLDELPEFPRMVLETLRQPLEDHVVTIARSHSAVRFPANFMLVAAMNPTPKGDMAKDEVSRAAQERYLSRLSGPLIDRIDIHVEAPAVPFKQLAAAPRGTSSAMMRDQVLCARERQNRRQGPTTPNSRLSGKKLDELAPLDEVTREYLGRAITELGLSARAYDKIRRVSRTIADLAGSDKVETAHVSEAISYRLLDRKT